MMLQQRFFYIVAFIFSVFLTLILLETGVRVLNLVNPKSIWLQIHDRGYFMNQAGGSALHTFDDRRVRYHFSELRTRGEVDETARKNIFVFGDSFTFGLLLNKDDTFVELLNKKATESFGPAVYNFVNAGVGGTGLADWVARIENDVDKLPMDGVLFVFNYDDFARALHSNLYIVDNNSELLTTSSRWRQKSLKNRFDQSQFFQQLQERSHLISGTYTVLYPYLFEDMTAGFDHNKTSVPLPTSRQLVSFDDYNIKLAEYLLSRTKEITYSLNIPLWMTTTGFIDFDFVDVNRFYNEYVFTNLDSISRHLSIPYKDISPEFRSAIDNIYTDVIIQVDRHPNEAGSILMANKMFDFLKPLLEENLN